MRESVIKTLSYYDIFDYPLTAEELFLWSWNGAENIEFSNFIRGLEILVRVGLIEKKDSYYFLPAREDIIEVRRLIAPELRKKIKVARMAAWLIRYIPFVRAFFLCNMFSVSTREQSDIDTFIVVRKNRLWISRFLIILIFHIFNLRIKGNNSKNKICLSFYVTDDNLDLSCVAIDEPDIYLTYWIDQLIPVFDYASVSENIRAQNKWIKKYIKNSINNFCPSCAWSVKDTIISKTLRELLEKLFFGNFGNYIEKKCKKIQMNKLNKKYPFIVSGQKDIIVNDSMLKFHENDRRIFFKEKWNEKVSIQLGNI